MPNNITDTYYFETREPLQFQFLKYFEWKTQEAGYLVPGIGTVAE